MLFDDANFMWMKYNGIANGWFIHPSYCYLPHTYKDLAQFENAVDCDNDDDNGVCKSQIINVKNTN